MSLSRRRFVGMVATLGLTACVSREGPGGEADVPPWVRPHLRGRDDDPRAAALRWFDEARLGMFVHWGVWGPRHAEWAMFSQKIDLPEYQALARGFRGEAFDACALVALARAAGMRYITFVAKHHDGFCLWRSAHTPWNSWDYPARRDFLRELSEACAEAGLPLFVYYSLGLDWTHPGFLPRSRYPFATPDTPTGRARDAAWREADFESYRRFCLDQLEELCGNYGPLAGFWFDPLGALLANESLFRTEEIYARIRRLQPHALILNKTGVTGTEDVVVGERELASISRHYPGDGEAMRRIRALADRAWGRNRLKKAEIAVASQGTWAWSPSSACRPSDELHRMLALAAANNANLLLNVGPMPDGSLPADVRREFTALGSRLRSEGYPSLDRTGWLARREGPGGAVDGSEVEATAR